nr:virulence protein RhuM/Fic/DOC family protein [Gammaproteobacteria bacterium]
MSEIIIFKAKDGHVELDVSIAHETLWLSQQQIADLFGTKRQAITKHLKNIFLSEELSSDSVSSKMEHTSTDGKKYQILFYNLDAIISVSYRVNSTQATQFRVWATQVLKDHLVRGYTVYEKRLAERGVKELQQSIELLQKTLTRNDLVNDIGIETIQLIMSYTKTWHLLLAYDEDTLTLPTQGKPSVSALRHEIAVYAIETLKSDLAARNEATDLFGNEYNQGLKGILGNIEQTFGGKLLYKTAEELAAHLFYFIIKDHPFSDGNKRIGCLIFLLYLKLQNSTIKINDNGLVALALLVAESAPQQKGLMIRLVVNL